MNTQNVIHLLVGFYKAHYGAIFILAILSQFGLIKFIWNTIQFAGSLIYLGYAYIAVGVRKLKSSKESKITASTNLL